MKLPTLYAVVRRDLPLDAIMPQAGHAILKASMVFGLRFLANFMPTSDCPIDPLLKDETSPILIIKGAKNEGRLQNLHERLVKDEVAHVTWVEPDPGPFQGQLTSLALLPGEKEALAPFLNDYHNLNWGDVPTFPNVAAALKQERIACAGIARRSQHECVVCGPSALVTPKPDKPCAACLEAARIEGAIRGRNK